MKQRRRSWDKKLATVLEGLKEKKSTINIRREH